jgi:adenine-specific DNA-methyltransferase
VEKYHLAHATRTIIGKTDQLKGIILTKRDFSQLVENGRKVYMFAPKNVPLPKLSKEEQSYIKYGEESAFHTRYKCRIRKNWYCVPQSWEPQAFILRQVHRYPRIILNHVNAVCTDTIHKVRFLDGVHPDYVTAAFLNSFTLALAEITGRSYGGGVLTFEPSEIRKLMIPMKNAELLDVKKIDRLIRANNIESVLDLTDEILLMNGLGLSSSDVKMLRNIWVKLRERRLGRKERL